MPLTSFMNLTLPTVSVTLGPEWASELNTALETLDAHDHTSGKGKQIPLSALSILSDLDMLGFAITNVEAVHLNDLSSTQTGASNASTAYVYNGDLYYTNGSGVAVQITSGGSVVTSPASLQALDYITTSSSLSIGPGDSTVTVGMDSTVGARTVTLPLASAVATGRLYVIVDQASISETNNITIAPTGADTIAKQANAVLRSNGASVFLQSDGISNYVII